MKKKFFSVCFILCLLISACTQAQNPDDVVASYLTLLYQGKTESAYQYIRKKDQAQTGIYSFKESHYSFHDPLFRPFYDKAKFTVSTVSVHQNTAAVTVEQDVLDYKTVYELCSRTINGNTALKDHRGKHEALANSLGNKPPFIKKTITYRLEKEHGHWKIRFPQ